MVEAHPRRRIGLARAGRLPERLGQPLDGTREIRPELALLAELVDVVDLPDVVSEKEEVAPHPRPQRNLGHALAVVVGELPGERRVLEAAGQGSEVHLVSDDELLFLR